jgi:malate dehydrogenase (oxaloacetate-decarboxylating)
VAVVSDGSALQHNGSPVTPESVAPLLHDDATRIHDLTGLPVLALPVAAQDAAQLAARLAGLPDHVAAVFLTETDPARARAAQHTLEQWGGPVVITDQDTTAIALAAATVTALRRAGRAPTGSRVVIAGADTMPVLCPLLMAVGVGDIGSWRQADALDYPLHRIARTADVVIDLVAAAGHLAAGSEDPSPVVLRTDDPGYPWLALPGLLTETVGSPRPWLDIDIHRTCVLALAATTPPGALLPESDPSLTDLVASAVIRTLKDHARPHPNS